MININKMKGKIKCKEKKKVNILCPTEKLLHKIKSICFPKKGTTVKNLVITLAPQKDICPQGNTYPIKAVNIKINNNVIPLAQTVVLLYLL
jgi:hypothetical protein